MAVGSISAAKEYKPDLKVTWIDAHADINNENTSPSGNLHGMPVAILAGLSEQFKDQFKCLDVSTELQYIGVRDVDPGERELIEKH